MPGAIVFVNVLLVDAFVPFSHVHFFESTTTFEPFFKLAIAIITICVQLYEAREKNTGPVKTSKYQTKKTVI